MRAFGLATIVWGLLMGNTEGSVHSYVLFICALYVSTDTQQIMVLVNKWMLV